MNIIDVLNQTTKEILKMTTIDTVIAKLAIKAIREAVDVVVNEEIKEIDTVISDLATKAVGAVIDKTIDELIDKTIDEVVNEGIKEIDTVISDLATKAVGAVIDKTIDKTIDEVISTKLMSEETMLEIERSAKRFHVTKSFMTRQVTREIKKMLGV